MRDKIVTVFGASGFLGRAITEDLASAGYRIRAGTRRPHEALFLRTLGRGWQVEPVFADVTDASSIEKALEGSAAAVNCVGILYEAGGKRKFSKVQAKAPGLIGRMAKKAGLEALIHISAIGASPQSPAKYARTKAEGEKALQKEFPEAAILRPSIIFGPDDNFFNLFGKMAKSPFQPLTIVGPDTRFQPVYVEDVAKAVTKAVLDPAKYAGNLYELGGPKTYSFRELIDYTKAVIGKDAKVFTIPIPLASLMGAVFQVAAKIFPLSPPITLDQVKLLKTDNVVSGKEKGFEAFGIAPTPLEAIVPGYLTYLRSKGQFG